LAQEFQDRSRKGIFLYFLVFPSRKNEFLGPKTEKISLNRVKNVFSLNRSIWV
jgi:hypothetical protein